MTASLIFVLCVGCSSLVERTGRIIDGSAFEERKIARYRIRERGRDTLEIELLHAENRSGQRLLVISQNQFPAVTIRATEPNEDGLIHFISVDYMSGNTFGWNQFSLGLLGTGFCLLHETEARFFLNDDIEKIQINHGKIRLLDTTIIGADAVVNLNNRGERIEALVEWMLEYEEAYGLNRRAFRNFWKPILFPEISSQRKRPEGWKQDSDNFVRAEDIRWNTGYSQRVFPEELWPVRNSGTLLRDWEEAFEWIYLMYEWDTFIGMFSREITLKRIR
jgi:hypothetical protein